MFMHYFRLVVIAQFACIYPVTSTDDRTFALRNFAEKLRNQKENRKVNVHRNWTVFDENEGPPLSCMFEVEGRLDGTDFEEHEQLIDCDTGINFCQKITAHYFDVRAGSETQIVMKGCDDIQLPEMFDGTYCSTTGCAQRIIDFEEYTVCCCKGNLCNSQTNFNYIIVLISISIITLLS